VGGVSWSHGGGRRGERRERPGDGGGASVLTVFGACVVTFMMLMYALEGRDRRFVLAFAVGCALSSSYGFLAGTWPFGIVEGIWSLVAVRRYLGQRSDAAGTRTVSSVESASARSGSVVIDKTRSEASWSRTKKLQQQRSIARVCSSSSRSTPGSNLTRAALLSRLTSSTNVLSWR
ncbi:MAG: hypothetical protein WBP81_27435, partial [Solirubrobacteraceae bacterium]